MISVNYIAKFLDNKQTKIDDVFYNNLKDFERNNNIETHNESTIQTNNLKTNKFYLNLDNSLEILFNKNIHNFYYDNKIYKNKSPVFTLLNSIFTILDDFFNIHDESEKENIIKTFLKNMDEDLFIKDLYTKYGYNKNKKFNKAHIQEILKNVYHFKSYDYFDLFKEYLCDYLSINIFILKSTHDILDIENSEYYLTKYYNNQFNKYLPTLLILNNDGLYKPIIYNDIKAQDSIIKYSKEEDLINNLFIYFKLNELMELQKKEYEQEKESEIETKTVSEQIITGKKYNISEIKNLKIEELQKLCETHNISILKKSEKTGKDIKKLKLELINDLLNLI